MKVTYDPHLLGPKGEQIAADYLLNKGYRIIKDARKNNMNKSQSRTTLRGFNL